MIAVVINAAAVVGGSLVGLLIGNKLQERFFNMLIKALALCIFAIAIKDIVGSTNTLCVLLCVAAGSLIGEALKLQDKLDGLGEILKNAFAKGEKNKRFTEGFINATLLYCVGALAIIGSINAGMKHDYSLLLFKSLIEFVVSMMLASSLGIGVMFSAAVILVYQGSIALLAEFLAPLLTPEVTREIGAVGGVLLIGMSINNLDLSENKIRLVNMIPAIFLPIGYLPLERWIQGLLG